MKKYSADLNIGMEWILRDREYLEKKDIKEKFAEHWYVPREDLSSEFLDWLDQNQLDIYYSELFYCSAGGNIFLHVDEIEPANVCKLNWVYDNGKTWMNWYELKPGEKISKRDNTIGGIYYDCDRSACELVERSRIGKPTLVNAGVLHDVINPTDHPRWCLSIVPQFKNDLGPMTGPRLGWQQGIKVFKNWIK